MTAIILASILGSLFTGVTSIINTYGYAAVFILMLLEAAALPIPSEIVLPLTGLLAAQHVFNIFIALALVLLAGFIGMAVDYYIAYTLEKDVVYKHLQSFRIKKGQLEAFDRWFGRNGGFAVFIGRLLPEVRSLVSFPAGFAAMPKKKFFSYSMAGTAIWDVALLTFGYYALNANNAYVLMIAIALFAIVTYALYRIAVGRGKKG